MLAMRTSFGCSAWVDALDFGAVESAFVLYRCAQLAGRGHLQHPDHAFARLLADARVAGARVRHLVALLGEIEILKGNALVLGADFVGSVVVMGLD